MSRTPPTTGVERALLAGAIVLVPFDYFLPDVGPFSTLFLVFTALALYAGVRRGRVLRAVLVHPAFVPAYALLVVAAIVESMHPHASYVEVLRMARMVGGGVVVAALCRDARALLHCVRAFVGVGVLMSAGLTLVAYRRLWVASALDFDAASTVREAAFAQVLRMQGDLNVLGLTTALGTTLAVALALWARSRAAFAGWLGVATFCGVATFLPMSRGAVVNALGGAAAVMLAARSAWRRALGLALVFLVAVPLLVPGVVFSRLEFAGLRALRLGLAASPPAGRADRARADSAEGRPAARAPLEARAHLYEVAVRHAPAYLLRGVGAGHFWAGWGWRHGFGNEQYSWGPQNVFIEVTVYWGLAGLLALLALVWPAARCLPRPPGAGPLALAMFGYAVATLLYALMAHAVYAKPFALFLGLAAAARLWIWPDARASGETA